MFSIRHGAMYDEMVSELLRFGGFRASVNDKLREIIGHPSDVTARWIDDLYSVYSDESVIDDED